MQCWSSGLPTALLPGAGLHKFYLVHTMCPGDRAHSRRIQKTSERRVHSRKSGSVHIKSRYSNRLGSKLVRYTVLSQRFLEFIPSRSTFAFTMIATSTLAHIGKFDLFPLQPYPICRQFPSCLSLPGRPPRRRKEPLRLNRPRPLPRGVFSDLVGCRSSRPTAFRPIPPICALPLQGRFRNMSEVGGIGRGEQPLKSYPSPSLPPSSCSHLGPRVLLKIFWLGCVLSPGSRRLA